MALWVPLPLKRKPLTHLNPLQPAIEKHWKSGCRPAGTVGSPVLRSDGSLAVL